MLGIMDTGGLSNIEAFGILAVCGGSLLYFAGEAWHKFTINKEEEGQMPKQDRWEIIQEPTGWTVEHNGRNVEYDLPSLNDAKAKVRRKGGTAALRSLRVVDLRGTLLQKEEQED